MDNAEKLLRKWRQQPPTDAVDVKDAIAVMKRLGMDVREGSKHLVASHPALVGSDLFPNGTITVSSHAFGDQGKTHPKAVKDILKAAKIIQEKDEDD